MMTLRSGSSGLFRALYRLPWRSYALEGLIGRHRHCQAVPEPALSSVRCAGDPVGRVGGRVRNPAVAVGSPGEGAEWFRHESSTRAQARSRFSARNYGATASAAGMSQDDLGRAISYSGALVGRVEMAERMPSQDFADRCDEALNTGGFFGRFRNLVKREAFPSWFGPFVEYEEKASKIYNWDNRLVPGLLQTEDYARANASGPTAGGARGRGA